LLDELAKGKSEVESVEQLFISQIVTYLFVIGALEF